MNIAYLCCDRGVPVFGTKGAAIHLREMVSALVACGHRVAVLAAARGDSASTLSATVAEVEAASLPGMPSHRPAAARSALGRELEARRLSVAAVGRVRALAASARVDLIYERYSLWSTAGIDAAKELGIPCLVEVNAPLVDEQGRYRELVLTSVARAIEGRVFQEADGLLVVSETLRRHALARGADPARTWVVPNAVDTARFTPVGPTEVPPKAGGKFVVGFAGSLKPWHGLEILLDAFRGLLARSPAYHLVVVGDGPLRGWLEGYLQVHGLQEMVTTAGAVPHERVAALLRAMDVAVAPYPPAEMFYFSPLKLFEYMAAGRPIVASRVGQVREVIEDGVTGLLVEPGDPQDLIDSIERLRANPALRCALGAQARGAVEGRTWRRNAELVTAIAAGLARRRRRLRRAARAPRASIGSGIVAAATARGGRGRLFGRLSSE